MNQAIETGSSAPPPVDQEVPPPVDGSGPGPDDEVKEPSDRVSSGVREDKDLEALEPKTDPVERVLWYEDRTGKRTERTYIQRPIGYFPKIELYGILGQAVKIVLERDTGVDVETLLDLASPRRVVQQLAARMPGSEDAPSVEGPSDREGDALKIMAALAEVVSVAPDLLKDAYCVILNVPTGHREWVKTHALDNLTDEEGYDILETFIDQSWGAIEGFFTEWLPRAARRTVEARRRAEASRRSSGTR